MSSQNVSLAFASVIGSLGDEQQNAMAQDSCGNLYVTGSFSGTLDFDPSANIVALSTGTQSSNGYLAKYDAIGNLIWVKQFTAYQWSATRSLEVDNFGNIGLTGCSNGNTDLDPGPAVALVGNSNGVGQNLFVKLDALGNYLFGFTIGKGLPMANLVFDGAGDLYISGCFNGAVDLDAGPGSATVISTNGTTDFFICKYSSTGTFIWGKAWGANANDVIRDISVDNAGTVFALGTFQLIIDFDLSPAVFTMNASAGEVFIMKLSTAGNFMWAGQVGGSSYQNACNTISLDAASNMYICGEFTNTVDIDPSTAINTLTSSGAKDIYFLKLNAGGTLLWGQRVGAIGNDFSAGIKVANSGDIFVAGSFQQAVDFDAGPGNYFLSASGLYDGYLLRVNGNGNFSSVDQFAATSNTAGVFPSNVVVSPSGVVYFCGIFSGTADFNPSAFVQNQTSAGGKDAFLLKLSPCLDAPAKNCDVMHACARASVTLAPLGGNNLIWMDASTQSSVGVGQSFVTPILPAGTYTYYASASNCTVPNNNAVFIVSVSPSPSVNLTPTIVNVCIGSVINFSTSGASTYFWNNSATGQTSLVSFIASSNTVFTVKGTDTITSCSNSKTVSISVANCTGIQESSSVVDVSVFPNPFYDEISVESKTAGSAILVDCFGRQLAILDFSSGTTKVKFPEIQAGVYFLRINTNQSQSTFRIVKEEY